MKLLWLLLLAGCSTNKDGDSKKVTGGDCRYSEFVPVTLDYRGYQINEEGQYMVSYDVKSHVGPEFLHGATLNETCKNEFESRKTVQAFMKKIIGGSCIPLIVRPEKNSLHPDCIKMF